MTKGTLLIGLGVVALGTAALLAEYTDSERAYAPRGNEFIPENARGIAGAMEYYNMLRANVNTGQVEMEDVLNVRKAVHAKAASQTEKAVGLQWIEMGPDNVGGRTRAIAVNPNNLNEIWAGGVSGGLWKSDNGANQWQQVSSFAVGANTNAADDNVNVASIGFAGNGDILVGTGSLFDFASGSGGSGFIGGGLYRSSDQGSSWQLLEGPVVPFSGSQAYAFVDEIWPDPNDGNKVYVGHNRGLDLWDLSSGTFTEVTNGLPNNLSCEAMSMSLDGQVMLVVMNSDPYLSTDGGGNFSNISSQVGVGAGRCEVAISPDNADYMYALSANNSGSMNGVFGSSDRGQTWASLWPDPVPQAMDIFGDNGQGGYDNIIEVVPGHPDQFWVGGVSLWKGSITGQPLQIAVTASFPGCFNCVHADVHEITWDLVNEIAYVGTDGGVFTGFSAGGGEVFVAANRGYNVTQFYGIGIGHDGRVIGGTQDNSTPYLTLDNPNSILEARVLFGGDGFDAEISFLDPNILFATSQNGPLGRSADNGQNFGSFYSTSIDSVRDGDGELGDFYTNIRLWETYDDPNSPNTTDFNNIGIDTVFPGETFEYRGRNTSIPLFATANSIIYPDSIVTGLPDPVQSLFAVGFSGSQGVWVTRDALAVNLPAEWWQVHPNAGNVNCLEWSDDGCTLFVGNTAGAVHMITGFCEAYTYASANHTARPITGLDTLISVATGDTITAGISGLNYAANDYTYLDGSPVEYSLYYTVVHSQGGTVTGIASDKNDPNHLVVTYGGYGGSNKVMESNNVMGAATFSNIWNPGSGLNGMPVYDAIIHVDDPNIIVAGTEWGVFATDNGGSSWAMENDGGSFVPVFAVRQQRATWQTPHWYGPDWVENPGVIYLGTHGRGAFRSETLLSVQDDVEVETYVFNDLTIFPNPSSTNSTFIVNLNSNSNVTAGIYDLHGRFVKEVASGRMSAGERRIQFDVMDMANGTYILHLSTGNDVKVGRFVVQH